MFGAKCKASGMHHNKAYSSEKAVNAADFLGCLKERAEGDVKSIQSDNGVEYKAEFESAIKEQEIPHLLIKVACQSP